MNRISIPNIVILICFLSLSFPEMSKASNQCYQIKQKDQRNHCLGLSNGNVSSCYNIKNKDLRTLCLAQIMQDKWRCYDIKDRDQRYYCLSLF